MSRPQPAYDTSRQAPLSGGEYGEEDSDRVQIVERLSWTPKQRLAYLVDMIAFEERARRARRLG
jgi:hypothetical protein